MKSKSCIAIPIILIVAIGLALFALWPKPSIEFKDESVLGHTVTSVVLEDWTLVPPAHRFDIFPESFFYHTIYVAPVQPGLVDYINANKPTVTYYLNGEAKQIQFK